MHELSKFSFVCLFRTNTQKRWGRTKSWKRRPAGRGAPAAQDCCGYSQGKKSYGDETGEEKLKQMVANTSQKGDILDIDNDNLQHTKLLWGLTTSKILNIIKNRKNIV